MAFANKQERLEIWQATQAAAQERHDNVDADYPAADVALRARIKASEADSIRTAREFVEYYEDLIANNG